MLAPTIGVAMVGSRSPLRDKELSPVRHNTLVHVAQILSKPMRITVLGLFNKGVKRGKLAIKVRKLETKQA